MVHSPVKEAPKKKAGIQSAGELTHKKLEVPRKQINEEEQKKIEEVVEKIREPNEEETTTINEAKQGLLKIHDLTWTKFSGRSTREGKITLLQQAAEKYSSGKKIKI